MGIRFLDEIVDMGADRNDWTGAALYRDNSYDVVNQALDGMALRVANTLQRQGYRAFPIPASKRVSDQQIAGGLLPETGGAPGRSRLDGKELPARHTGPRAEGTVDCCADRCHAHPDRHTDICPAYAFTGRPSREDEPREARFDATACERYFKEHEAGSNPGVCGLYLYVCPHGRKRPEYSAGKLQK